MKINKKYILLRFLSFPLKLIFMVFWGIIYTSILSVRWLLYGSQELFFGDGFNNSNLSEIVKHNENLIENYENLIRVLNSNEVDLSDFKTSKTNIPMNISFPVKDCRKGIQNENGNGYAFIITDANNVEHFFNKDGTYDGYAHDPCMDGESGTCLN